MTRTALCCALAALALTPACGGTEAPLAGLDAGGSAGVDAGAPGPDAALAGEDASVPPDAAVVDAPPTVELEGFAEFSTLKSTFPVNVKAADDRGLAKLELFVGDSPTAAVTKTVSGAAATSTLNLGTLKLSDGLTTVHVRVTDTAGQTGVSATLPAVVCNQGKEALAADGLVEVPANFDPATMDVDQKHHWDNPAGITKILGILSWTADPASPFDLGLVVGRGECPHSGQALCNEVFSKASPLTVEALPTGADAVTGLHFIHIRPNDAPSHKGHQQPYRVKVFLW